MTSTGLGMPAGETLSWSVSFRGMRLGTAALDVRGQPDALRVESRFQTIGLAAQVRPVKHRLVTSLSSSPSRFEDVHSALGRVRAWADADAHPATLRVRHAQHTYLLKLAQPLLDTSLAQPTWRIEAEASSQGPLIKMTLWLSTDTKRVPVQMTISQQGQQIQAQLLEASES